MRSVARTTLALLLLAACNPGSSGTVSTSADSGDGSSEPPPGTTGKSIEAPPLPQPPEPDPFDPGPGKPAEPPSREKIDAPISTTRPMVGFWRSGHAACEPDGRLEGSAPPGGTEVRCVDAQGRWTGMEARFHEGDRPNVQMTGRRRDGRMEDVWQWFDVNGDLIAEHPYRDGELHGTLVRWASNGQEIESGEYRAGRPWGLFVRRDETGKELARSQLDRGTGVLINVDDYGRTESDYVAGLLHGKHRRFDLQGKLIEESDWSGGEWHGPQTRWDPSGQEIAESHYKLGKQHGRETLWKDGQIIERSIHVDGVEISRQLYRDGQPLAPLPAPTDCDRDPGLSAMLQTARGSGLPREHACVTRMALFPGVIMLGEFAYDHGCMSPQWVVDCKLVEPGPSAAELLARAGWARATPEQRIEIAEEYVREFGLAWSGSISWTPDEPKWTSLADGGVQVVLWIAEPSGMRPGREIAKQQFEFAADGTLTAKTLEQRTEGRD